jgi:predicted TIM-barrel fold metal-dependent hydrolase
MFKKPIFLIGLLGALLIIAGLILSPSLVGKFTEGGTITTPRGLIAISLFQFYVITFGGILVLESLIINLLPKERRITQFILGISFIGIVLTLSGIILSPLLIKEKLNLFGRFNPEMANSLYLLQLVTITLGSLIVFVSLFFYRKKSPGKKKFGLVVLSIIPIIYLILVYTYYIAAKYPTNTILKSGTYNKVSDLLLGKDILLSDFDPQSSLKLEGKQILKAKYPVYDFHFHFTSDFFTEEDLRRIAPDALVKSMDSVGVKTIVGLCGLDVETPLNRYQKKYPGRFLIFFNILLGSGRVFTDEFLSGLPAKLEDYVKRGASGLGEFPKDLGINLLDSSRKIIAIDDPRLDPLYAKAGELGMPILWHTADPTPFFQRIDRYNERFSELGRYPQWSYFGPDFPSKETLMKQKENVLKKHPETIIIGGHFDFMTDDLKHLEYFLDTYPNYYIEFGSILAELGRQPYTTRKFFIKYQDRILFGTDGGALFTKGWTVEKLYQAYFEFLETENEYIDYPLKGAINQGNWKIYGINLPDEVLEKIYYKNSEKILFKSKK